MTDRENLVELIQSAIGGCSEYWVGLLADHLIANGVTFATDNNDGSKTSKQKTKDILDWVQSTAEVDWGFMCCLKQELEQLVAIASRDDASGGKWIPVTERLPENICPVLVALEGISTSFNGWYHDGKWWTVGAGTRPFTQKVTHWMPLPTPPKGE